MLRTDWNNLPQEGEADRLPPVPLCWRPWRGLVLPQAIFTSLTTFISPCWSSIGHLVKLHAHYCPQLGLWSLHPRRHHQAPPCGLHHLLLQMRHLWNQGEVKPWWNNFYVCQETLSRKFGCFFGLATFAWWVVDWARWVLSIKASISIPSKLILTFPPGSWQTTSLMERVAVSVPGEFASQRWSGYNVYYFQ